jgi:N-acetylneuraminate synthase
VIKLHAGSNGKTVAVRQHQIDDRVIGDGHPPWVIAEVGINHNGSLAIAREMVDSAARSGCEVVKFQSHVIEDEMSHHARATIPGNTSKSIYEVMESCALNEDEERELKEYVEQQGMLFLCTPFSRAAALRLERLDVRAFKIGSGECNNYPLVSLIASFGKPVIVSTGMNSIPDIRKTVAILRDHGTPFALLHCTNVYPTPPHLVRLGAMQQMMDEFPNVVVGLSDHTLNNAACLAAVGMGADILERHYTDSKGREGPDICCSMTPDELSQLIAWSTEIAEMRGGVKGPVAAEEPTIAFAFASVVTVAEVKAGDQFSANNIWVKRPGTGEVTADDYRGVLGKRASRDLAADEQLNWNDITY